jgi:transposase
LFESLERAALKPLPKQRYEFAEWRKARVNVDCHIEFAACYYSAPYQLIKETVELRVTANTVEIFHKGRRIASHHRRSKKGTYSTTIEHLPPKHREYLEWDSSRIISWAKSIGPNTSQLVAAIIDSKNHPQLAFRSCFGVMRLGKLYSAQRMEAAAIRALNCKAISYQSLKSILEKGLDQLQLDLPVELPPVIHQNVRGADYFNTKGVQH